MKNYPPHARRVPSLLRRGFSLTELLIAMALIGMLGAVLSRFQRDIWVSNAVVSDSLVAESAARSALRQAIADLRSAAPAATGDYPIILADKNAITFFSDTNKDGKRERIRYYAATSTLWRGVTAPSGPPYLYNDSNEVKGAIVPNLVMTATSSIFSYYDGSYVGSSSPMSLPINIPSIRLIQVKIVIEADPRHSPAPLEFISQVSIRSLKTNL